MKRIALTLGLLVLTAGIQARSAEVGPPGDGSAGDRRAWSRPPSVPEAVYEAMEQGRFWRGARLLDDYLEEMADTTPATLLLAARLHAGWGNWPGVRRLLEDRAWLGDLDRGAAWSLLGRARIVLGDPAAGAEALARYVGGAELDPGQEGLSELRRGLALGRADRADAAFEAFDRAAALLPWFADWAHFLAAEAAAGSGLLDEVNRRLAAAGAAGAGHWRLRVVGALEAGDTMAARETSLAATRTGSRTDRSEAWAELGRLRLAAGEAVRARAAFARAMEVRSSVGAVDAARLLWDLGPSPEEWRAIAAVYQRHGNPSRAADGYAAYLDAGAGNATERARARLELGRSRFNAGRFRQAERGLLALADGDVSDRVGAEALYLAGRAQYRQGRTADGQATFLRAAERFPGEEAATRGLYLLADLKHDDLETDGAEGARVYYRRAAEASPGLNEAGLARMRLAGLEFLDGDYREAAETWEEYRTLHPTGRRIGQATYWAARAYARMGQDSLAEARLRELRGSDPISYYGLRAAELLDRSILDFPMADSVSVGAGADSVVQAGIRRVDLLAALDRRSDLIHEVERLRGQVRSVDPPTGEYALAEALNERGYTLTGIDIGWELYRRTEQWNRRLLRIVYPFPFRRLVVAEAADRGLDPYLVAGLIRKESAFSPVVVSGAEATGLMQIVPATGRVLARNAGLRSFASELLMRPEVNLHLGTRFLAELLDRFGDDLPLALAAYNAGPTRATVWRHLPEADDPELFTERIPYGETRDYIRNVILHRALYRSLYPEVEADTYRPAPAPGMAGPGIR